MLQHLEIAFIYIENIFTFISHPCQLKDKNLVYSVQDVSEDDGQSGKYEYGVGDEGGGSGYRQTEGQMDIAVDDCRVALATEKIFELTRKIIEKCHSD